MKTIGSYELKTELIACLSVYFLVHMLIFFHLKKKNNQIQIFKKPIIYLDSMTVFFLLIRVGLIFTNTVPFFEQKIVEIMNFPVYNFFPNSFILEIAHTGLTLLFLFHLVVQFCYLKAFSIKSIIVAFKSSITAYIITTLVIILLAQFFKLFI